MNYPPNPPTALQILRSEDINRRLDAWLAEHKWSGEGTGPSRSAVKRLLEDGGVTVNGKPAKPAYKTRLGDIIEVTLPQTIMPRALPEDIPLDIIYEDSKLIVVNKGRGMVVHPAPGHFTGTLVNALLHHCAGELSGINGVLRPGIIHRIDKDTSGLLVAAKTDDAHTALSAQLAARKFTRKYEAIVCGRLNSPVTIDKPIARHKSHRKKMAVDPEGRKAVTHITPKSFLTKIGVHTHIEARLETGRTHQIRVHMAAINRPVLGDPLYGGTEKNLCPGGQALHAATLGFCHPSTGKYMEFFAPLPAYFRELLIKL